jgi:hypothetical protein
MPVKNLGKELRQLEGAIPSIDYEEITFTFPATPNIDYAVPHALRADNPDDIRYLVVAKDRACDVYNDQSGTRVRWTEDYILLRCSVASATVTLLLYVPR